MLITAIIPSNVASRITLDEYQNKGKTYKEKHSKKSDIVLLVDRGNVWKLANNIYLENLSVPFKIRKKESFVKRVREFQYSYEYSIHFGWETRMQATFSGCRHDYRQISSWRDRSRKPVTGLICPNCHWCQTTRRLITRVGFSSGSLSMYILRWFSTGFAVFVDDTLTTFYPVFTMGCILLYTFMKSRESI